MPEIRKRFNSKRINGQRVTSKSITELLHKIADAGFGELSEDNFTFTQPRLSDLVKEQIPQKQEEIPEEIKFQEGDHVIVMMENKPQNGKIGIIKTCSLLEADVLIADENDSQELTIPVDYCEKLTPEIEKECNLIQAQINQLGLLKADKEKAMSIICSHPRYFWFAYHFNFTQDDLEKVNFLLS